MIFVIYGEESFLMEQKLQSLKKEYDCNEDNMNISTYRANEDSLEEVYEDLITPPFLTDKKMVVLKNPYFLTTKKVKKDNNELEYFEKCLINSEEVIFVILEGFADWEGAFIMLVKILMSVKKLLKIYVNKHNFLK